MPVGESTSFDCLPEAWPEPQIHWRFNGQPIDLGATLAPSNDNHNHNQRANDKSSIQPADGPHQIPATSINNKYKISRLARTEVEQRPTTTTNQQQSTLFAKTGPMNLMKIGDNNQSAATSGSVVDFYGSRLQINQVDKSDEGRYSCLVETKGSHRIIERESQQAQLLAFGKLKKKNRK